MGFGKWIGGFAILALIATGTRAQEDPEAVYARLHRATLAGNAEEVLSFGTAAARAELAAKPQAERDAMIRSLAQVLPKTYSITEKTIAPDGNSATLRGTGISEFQGRAESYLAASFRKEGGAWKVATWGWSNQKPPPPAAKPAAPAAAAPAPPAAAELPQEIRALRRRPAPAAGPAELAPAPVPAPAMPPVAAVKRPSRALLDARACLRLATDKAIMACAEKYR